MSFEERDAALSRAKGFYRVEKMLLVNTAEEQHHDVEDVRADTRYTVRRGIRHESEPH